MDRSQQPSCRKHWVMFGLLAVVLASSTGCAQLIATVVYAWNGGNFVDADYEGLEEKRVVVVCQPPASQSFSHVHVDRQLARRVGSLLEMNVEGIEVVDWKEVDNWSDETDGENFRELARSVDADMVVKISLDNFDLYNGPTLYQGQADIMVTVHDMDDNGKLAWEKEMPELLYPVNSGVPTTDKSPDQFRRQFIGMLSEQISRHFYKHDPHIDFAMDAAAHR